MKTWTDKSRELEWQVMPSTGLTAAEADEYAATIDLCGGGWELPTLEELLSISGSNCPHALQGNGEYWSSGECWTSTVTTDRIGGRWVVHFGGGMPVGVDVSERRSVRCVRRVGKAKRPEEKITMASLEAMARSTEKQMVALLDVLPDDWHVRVVAKGLMQWVEVRRPDGEGWLLVADARVKMYEAGRVADEDADIF